MKIDINLDDIDKVVPIVSPIIEEKLKTIKSTNLIKNTFFDNCEYIGSGKFGNTYKKGDRAIKISHLLKKVNSLTLQNKLHNSTIENYLNEFDKEKEQIINYSQLRSLFPDNILNIIEVKLVCLENEIFPATMVVMNYVDGITLFEFVQFCEINQFNKILFDCMKVLLSSNIIGLFHNDINLSNILVSTDCLTTIIDYSFSKKINTPNKFPVECVTFLTELRRVICDDLKTEYFLKLIELASQLALKYDIFTTDFMEKILTGHGTFTQLDYENLIEMSQDDIDTLFSVISDM